MTPLAATEPAGARCGLILFARFCGELRQKNQAAVLFAEGLARERQRQKRVFLETPAANDEIERGVKLELKEGKDAVSPERREVQAGYRSRSSFSFSRASARNLQENDYDYENEND